MQIIILFYSLVIVNNVFCTVSFDWFNSLIETRMIQKNDEIKYLDAEKLIRKFGFESEAHDVLTDDGYWLTIHRILATKKNYKLRKPVVLIHHGFLAASDNFLFRGREKDLPYVLADAGYDVWMCNARGNFYSRRHVNYNPNVDSNYWKFSFHEMGIYDLPATMNYILSKTNENRLYFIGYSMGATISYILCSNKPEYNDKFKLIISLAPTAITNHQLKPFLKVLLTAVPPAVKLLETGSSHEFLPRSNVTSSLMEAFCNASKNEACLSMIFVAVGRDYEEFSKTLIPSIVKYYPAGTSIYTVYHYYQMFTTGSFAPLLTGINGSDPVKMSYNLSRISAPVAVYCADGDYVVTKEDCSTLMKMLPSAVGLFKISHKHFNHLDFMWATNAKSLLYDDLINLMNKFR